MTAPLRLLVATRPTQIPVFRIEPHHVDEALARSKLALPALAFDFCSVDDPSYHERLSHAFALFGHGFPTAPVRHHGRALRLIQLNSAGLEHLLPLDWLPRQVALATASGVHGPKLREWAGMVFMMLHTHMPHFVTAQRRHAWSKAYCTHIAGTRALIYGTGQIGQAVATAARRLGIETIGVRRMPAPARGFDRVIGIDAAQDIIPTVNFVVMATPLTPLTHHIANASMFAHMRKGCGFANFGRGGLVDQEALIAALTRGHLGGAVIDVTEPEPPPPTSPLWDTPNLIITPHVSCDDPIAYIPRTLDIFLDNVARRAAGRPVRNRVVRSRAY